MNYIKLIASFNIPYFDFNKGKYEYYRNTKFSTPCHEQGQCCNNRLTSAEEILVTLKTAAETLALEHLQLSTRLNLDSRSYTSMKEVYIYFH
jgi:hypothetical protein